MIFNSICYQWFYLSTLFSSSIIKGMLRCFRRSIPFFDLSPLPGSLCIDRRGGMRLCIGLLHSIENSCLWLLEAARHAERDLTTRAQPPQIGSTRTRSTTKNSKLIYRPCGGAILCPRPEWILRPIRSTKAAPPCPPSAALRDPLRYHRGLCNYKHSRGHKSKYVGWMKHLLENDDLK